MIVLDIETSGLSPEKNGIWQIGAIDLDNPDDKFIEEGRIDCDDAAEAGALLVIGKTEDELRDIGKRSQKELLALFFEWCRVIKAKTCLCQNPQFDSVFISMKARKYGMENPLHFRAFDLHSLAQMKHFSVRGNFFMEGGFSKMSLKGVLEFCGMEDSREAHNAIEDCMLEAECFSRLVYGKGMFEEYSQFKIPDYLKNKQGIND